jgi:hypothetical protein
VSTSATIGDALTTSADGSFSSDANPADNVASQTDSVVNSWDPNDILVSPAGVGPTGDIPMETEWLTYTIRFQPTGDHQHCHSDSS